MLSIIHLWRYVKSKYIFHTKKKTSRNQTNKQHWRNGHMRVNLCVCAFAKTKQWDALAFLVSRIRNRMFGWIFANVNVYFGSRVMRAMFRRPMSANNNSSSTDYGTKRKKLTTKKYVFVSEIDTRGWLHHRMFRTLSERVFAWVAIYERASNQFHVYLSVWLFCSRVFVCVCVRIGDHETRFTGWKKLKPVSMPTTAFTFIWIWTLFQYILYHFCFFEILFRWFWCVNRVALPLLAFDILSWNLSHTRASLS